MNLEHFRPRLRRGRVIPQGSRIIFETDNPYNQVILPTYLADLILLCSGQFSVREIVAKIYKKQGVVPFKSIVKAIHILHQGGFFENGRELNLNSDIQLWLEPETPRFERTWIFAQRLLRASTSPTAFYLVTLVLLIGGILGLQYVPASPLQLAESWLSTQNSLLGAAFKVICCTSILLSLKFALRATQLVMLTGKAYNLSIKVSPWGAHLHVGNEANDLFENRLYTAMFYVSQVLAPWLLLFAIGPLLHREWLDSMVLGSSLLLLHDLNPFRASDTLKLIQSLMIPSDADVASWHFEKSQLMDAIAPDQRQTDQEFARVCAIWGGIWLIVCLALLHETAYTFAGRLVHHATHLSLTSPVALGALSLWLFAGYKVLSQLIEVVAHTLARPHLQWLQYQWQSLRAPRAVQWAPQKLLSRIETLPLFSHLPEDALQSLLHHSRLIEFSRGSVILREGDPATDLYVLMEGVVDVTRKTRGARREFVSEIGSVSVFGEAALVDDQPRMAQATCKTACVVLQVPVKHLREVAESSGSIRVLEDFRSAIMVNQYFASSPIFRTLSQDSIEFLSTRGSLEQFARGQVVFHQGEVGEALYLILRGSVQVYVHNTKVKRLGQGGFFGEISLIANVPRTATIMAAEPTTLFKINSAAFWEVLVQHLELGVFLESISETRIFEDLNLATLRPTGSDSE